MNKPIAVTLVVLVLLALIYFLSGDPYSEEPTVETAGLKEFQELKADEVAKIIIAKGSTEPVEIVQQDDGWVVASRWNFEADEDKIENILESLENFEEPELVGETEASHADFEVSKIKGGFITLFDKAGKTLGRIAVGKTAPSANFRVTEVFVRFNSEPETYRVRSDIRSVANLYSSEVEAKRYLDTKLFELDETDEIVAVRIQRPGRDDLIVERRYREKEEPKKEKEEEKKSEEEAPETKEEKEPEMEEYFVVTQGTETYEVDEKKWVARGLLDRAKTVDFDDAVEPKDPAEYGLEKPQLKAVVSYRKKDTEGASVNKITLAFGNAIKDEDGEDKGYYFQFEGPGSKDRIMTVEKWDFSGWNKELKEFLPEPEEEEPEEDTKKEATSPEGQPETTGAAGSTEAAPEASGTSPEAGEGAPEPEARSTEAAEPEEEKEAAGETAEGTAPSTGGPEAEPAGGTEAGAEGGGDVAPEPENPRSDGNS